MLNPYINKHEIGEPCKACCIPECEVGFPLDDGMPRGTVCHLEQPNREEAALDVMLADLRRLVEMVSSSLREGKDFIIKAPCLVDEDNMKLYVICLTDFLAWYEIDCVVQTPDEETVMITSK